MKTIVLIVFSLSIFSCASCSATNKTKIVLSAPTPIADQAIDANANKFIAIPDANSDINDAKLMETEARNAKFEVVPNEWRKIDFENHSYPVEDMNGFIHLKNGEFEYSIKNRGGGHFGSGGNSYYVDLTGDAVKEAIVFATNVSCGGSCDGGAEIIYFYAIQNKKLNLLGRIKTGSRAYGCSIKSFRVKNKEIILEQFGRCPNNPSENEDKDYSCKFCVRDLTVSKYIFEGKKIQKKSSEIISAPKVNVMNLKGETYVIE